MLTPRRPWRSLKNERGAELLFIAEAGHWLANRRRRTPEAVQSIMAMLDRQQRVAASRATGRPLDI